MASHDASDAGSDRHPFGLRKPFVSGIVAPSKRTDPAWWFAFHRNRLVVEGSGDALSVPCRMQFEDLGLTAISQHYLGRLDGLACYAVDLADDQLPESLSLKDLRQLYGLIDENLFGLSGRAVQIVEWDRTHQYCGRCATPMETKRVERAKSCPACGLLNFPRLSPAVIVRVERGDEILLARSPHFAPGMYSLLAGFVEPGETLEETVLREIKEEVGITVQEPHYVTSQSWPFPNSLMLGFRATYVSGDIVLDRDEIEAAGWFTPDTIPPIPGRISIARHLIDAYLAKHSKAT
jgi:NAD+ diphosphatase